MVASATVSLTVKVATPAALVTPETVVIVEEPPPLASVTVLPATGCDWASFEVTVTVEVATPFGESPRPGAAATVDWAAVTGPTVNVTVAVWVTVIASVVSVAV